MQSFLLAVLEERFEVKGNGTEIGIGSVLVPIPNAEAENVVESVENDKFCFVPARSSPVARLGLASELPSFRARKG